MNAEGGRLMRRSEAVGFKVAGFGAWASCMAVARHRRLPFC